MFSTPHDTDEMRNQKIATNDKIVKVSLGIMTNILARQQRVKDPAVRYSLFLDKLCLSIDAAMAGLESLDLSEDTRNDIKSAIQKIQDEIMLVMDWIQQPSYSPDHPYGNRIMTDSAKSFGAGAKV